MSTLQMYIERAAQCRQEAASSSLPNVRDRALRSALAWDEMADKLRVTEAYQQANQVARDAALSAASG